MSSKIVLTRFSVFTAANGGKIAAEFVEIESGKRSDRPKLAAAIAKARAIRGVLCIARLDRLARNVAFVSAIMESGCEFVACDNPHANRLTLHILAAVAEAEGRSISERTKAALAAAKRRGVKLGTNRRGHKIDHAKGTRIGLSRAVTAAATKRAEAREGCYGGLLDDMRARRQSGQSFASIAKAMNDAGHTTTSGKAFAAMTVHRLLA